MSIQEFKHNTNRLRLFALIALMGSMQLLLLLPSVRAMGTPSWWDPNYKYRRKITITNNAGSLLSSGYSVKLLVDTAGNASAGKMQADGDDLRIVYWTGSEWTELDRVNETNFNTANTEIWFKTQASIPASGSDDNYYMYYGYTGATSPPANRSNVYYKFDDFNDGSIAAMWTQSKPVGTITESGGVLTISVAKTANDDWWGEPVNAYNAPIIYTAPPSGGWMVTVKLSSYTVGVNTHGGIMLYDDRQNVYLWGRYKREDGVDDFRLDKIISNVGTSPVVDYSSTTLPMFLRIRCDGTTKYYDLSIDGSSWIQVYSSTELTGMYVGMFAKRWGSGGSRAAIEAPFDNFKLRLYTPSEPSTSFSVEQTVIDNVEADGPYDVGETITVTWTNYDNFGAGENYINVEYYDQYLSQSLTIHSLSTTSESDSYGPIGNALGGHTIAVYVYTASGSTYDHNSAITKGDPWPETCTVNAGVSEFPLGAALLLLLASVSYFIIHRRYALNQNT